PPEGLRAWPPPGATPLALEGLYARLAEAGLVYGTAFQGLRSAWQRGHDLFAEVALPEPAARDAARFALHPALLAAPLHALAIGLHDTVDVELPFLFRGVSLRAVGASTLRVRIARRGSERSVSLALADAAGEPVAHIEALATRPASAAQLHGALLRVAWIA